MTGLAEIGTVMMRAAERRIEITAQNVSNASTPGYRPEVSFAHALAADPTAPLVGSALLQNGPERALRQTGAPLDLAVSGATFFVRQGDQFAATQSGQFRLDDDGRLIDGAGRILQAADGGDLVVSSASPTILPDGLVLVEGRPVAKVGTFALPADDRLVQDALPEALTDGAQVHQGAVLPSAVDMASEMVTLNAAMRQAESGAKVFQVWDDLLGRAITRFGEMGR
jgi:flagellar basal-body rod protein FlgG